MANVLPNGAQKKVWRLYRGRFVIMFSLFSLALSLLALLSLVPSYLALSIAAPPSSDITPGKGSAVPDAASAVARAQTLLRTLSPVLDSTSSPSMIIAQVLESRPKTLVVTRVTYDVSKKELSLVGSGNRSVISTYRDALTKDPRFATVSVPVSALVGSDGGTFSMTIKLPQE